MEIFFGESVQSYSSKTVQFSLALTTNYPHLMTDVLYIKVCEDHRVLSKSCHISGGITEGGDPEIIGFLIQNEESDDTWPIFFEHLKERGLQGTELIISDAHKGLVSGFVSLLPTQVGRDAKFIS